MRHVPLLLPFLMNFFWSPSIRTPVKIPVNVPPARGKNNDNVEDIGVPFLYVSAQLILSNTSKA